MFEKGDIRDMEDIRRLVDGFYVKVRSDRLLAPVFEARIQDNWPHHLEIMYRFWQTVLLGDHTYFGSPFMPHAGLPINHDHFRQWLLLFQETLDELFVGEKAAEARWRSDKMAEMFESRLRSSL